MVTWVQLEIAQQARRPGKLHRHVSREVHNQPFEQWIIIDAKVYDLSKFVNLHPGGAGVLLTKNVGVSPIIRVQPRLFAALTPGTAGKDATEAFFGLHRHEVLLRPQYARLQIGAVAGQKEFVTASVPGEPSSVPYAEPAWLSPGYHSPYYTDSHRKFQKAARKFFEEVVLPDAVKCEENGKRISQEVVDKLWCASFRDDSLVFFIKSSLTAS